MNHFTKSMMVGTMALSLVTTTIGCSGSDVAATIGAVAIVGGAVAIGVALDDNDHHRRRDWDRDHGRRDRHDGRRDDNRRHDDRGGRNDGPRRDGPRHRLDSIAVLDAEAAPVAVPTVEEAKLVVNAVDWSLAFNMSVESSDKFIEAMTQASDGDYKAIANLGLGIQDVYLLSNYSLPTGKGIDALSRALNQSPITTTRMITKILDIAKANKDLIAAQQ